MRQQTIVIWQNDYNLGVEEIDGQHQYLIELINLLWHGIVQRASQNALLSIMTELERYTVIHFTAEELFMHAIGYPEFEAHRELHKQFTSFIDEHKRKISSGEEVGLDVLHYLKDWLINHILKVDRAYAVFLEEKTAPQSFFQRFFRRFGS